MSVGEIALGGLYTSTFGGGVAETTRMIEVAMDLGVSLIDTAPGYGDSEETLGRAFHSLGSKADKLRISTKLGGRPKPFDPKDAKAQNFYQGFGFQPLDDRRLFIPMQDLIKREEAGWAL